MSYFPAHREDYNAIASYINDAENIYVTTHVNPDGDAVGSVMAAAYFLENRKKPFRIVIHSATPDQYRFLDPGGIIISHEANRPLRNPPRKGDVVFILDLGNYNRLGSVRDFLMDNDAVKIVIDHHPPESLDAHVAVVDPRVSSTGELVYDLFHHVDASCIDDRIARAVLTAIVTDTGYFSYSNTTATTHEIAASLYSYRVSTSEIRGLISTGYPLCRQKLLGFAIAAIEMSDCGRIAYSTVTRAMFENSGADREHTDGIIDHIRVIRDIQLAVLLIQEDENLFKVSFRSVSNVPANDIAEKLGGGGHLKAAGATLTGSREDVTERVLETATYVMDHRSDEESGREVTREGGRHG